MSAKISDQRRQSWTPPAQPEWVARMNAEGRCMDLDGLVPLDEQSLLHVGGKVTVGHCERCRLLTESSPALKLG